VLLADEDAISTQAQQYDPTSIINEVRSLVEEWRTLPFDRPPLPDRSRSEHAGGPATTHGDPGPSRR
jgi:hypothetical protein